MVIKKITYGVTLSTSLNKDLFAVFRISSRDTHYFCKIKLIDIYKGVNGTEQDYIILRGYLNERESRIFKS